MRLSKAQRDVLTEIRDGRPLVEFLTPDRDRLFFRTLGDRVHAKLNYAFHDGKRVGYRTFWVLFKHNLIRPSRRKPVYAAGRVFPDVGVTKFYLTERGESFCRFVPSVKVK